MEHVGGLSGLPDLPSPVLDGKVHWDGLLLLLEEFFACKQRASIVWLCCIPYLLCASIPQDAQSAI